MLGTNNAFFRKLLVVIISILYIIAMSSLSTAINTIVNYAPITAKNAAQIGLSFASEFINEPLLFNVNSTDYLDSASIKSGTDGTRRVWNVFIGDKVGIKKMTLLIVDKKIKEFTYDDIHNYEEGFYLTPGTYALSDMTMDSNEAINIAIKEKGLKPGNPNHLEDWLIGYHYDIDIFDTCLAIIVYGISPSGNLAKVAIDQKTGKIMGSIEKVGGEWTEL